MRRRNSRRNTTLSTTTPKGSDDPLLEPALDFYFKSYLPVHRGMAKNTILSYRQCFKKFVPFLEKRTGTKYEELRLSVLTYDAILDFLGHIEKKDGVCPRTRNQRTAAIKSFVKCCSLIAPGSGPAISNLQHIPQKRMMKKSRDYLTDDELQQVYSQIDLSARIGFRDFAIIKFMHNTGCRASEAANMRVSWLDFQKRLAHVWGKGAKERVIPLFDSTISFLEVYLRTERKTPQKGFEDMLFINRNGRALTRSGIYKMVKKHAARAAKFTASLTQKTISPHAFRHTCAMHLLQSGVSFKSIQDWLGHSDIDTTIEYAKMDIHQKKRTLDKFSRFDAMILKAFLTTKEFDWNTNPEIRQWLINLQNKDGPKK